MLTFQRFPPFHVNFDFGVGVCDPDDGRACTTRRRAAACGSVARGTAAAARGQKVKPGFGVGVGRRRRLKAAEMAPVTWGERERDARVAHADRRVTPGAPRCAAALAPRAPPHLDRGRARCRSGDGQIWGSRWVVGG